MRGAQQTAQAVADGIVAGIVAQLAQLAVEWGALPPDVIAEPGLITADPLPPETVPAESWPYITVVPRRTPRYVRTDIGEDTDTYLVAYDLAATVWARSHGYAETAAARDRATQALVQVLLVGEGAFAAGDIVVDRSTVAADYSPTGMDVELEAIVAAASVTFSVGSQELLVRPIPALRAAEPGWDVDVTAAPVSPDTLTVLPGGPSPIGTF